MSHSILNSYHLPTRVFKILKRTIKDDNLWLEVIPKRHHAICPECGHVSCSMYDTRTGLSNIRYEIWHGYVIWLSFRKRRFRCYNKNCFKNIFTEVIPNITETYRRSSEHFDKQCLMELQSSNFKTVQSEFNVSFSFIKSCLYRHISFSYINIDWNKEFPSGEEGVMGIDEHSYKKHKLVCTITNIKHGNLISILPDFTKKHLEHFLMSIPSHIRARIHYVSMDLTNRFPGAINMWLPNAKIAADHFHVIQLANHLIQQEKRVIEGLDRERKKEVRYWKLLLKAKEKLTKEERVKIDILLSNPCCSRLKKAYEIKEHLREALKIKDYKKAEQMFLSLTRLDVWNKQNLSRNELIKYSGYYRTFIKTLKKHSDDICVFIRTRITNAFTEGVHTKIKLLKRLSYGFVNFKTYSLRMILAFQKPFFTHQV